MPNCVFIECSKILSKILNNKNIITIFGVIGQNFGPVHIWTPEKNAHNFRFDLCRTAALQI